MKSICKQKLEIEMSWYEASAIIDCMERIIEKDKKTNEVEEWLGQMIGAEYIDVITGLFRTIKSGLEGSEK